MTTKKRSKPRAIYQVFDRYGCRQGESCYETKRDALSTANGYRTLWPEDGPWEVVKYVREVKRK